MKGGVKGIGWIRGRFLLEAPVEVAAPLHERGSHTVSFFLLRPRFVQTRIYEAVRRIFVYVTTAISPRSKFYMLIQIRNADSFSAYIYICRRRQQFTGGGGETGCEKVITEGKTYRINFDRSSLNFLSPACCKPVNPNGTSFAHHRVSRWSRLVNPQREGKREEKYGELYHRNHSSSCARSVVWSVECVVGIASERERKREQLAGPPRAPASFLASRRVCKLPRGRRTMVIPMEDWPCTLCRPQVRDANLLVAG